ncbi:YecA family protein [Mesosutterella sp. OilRF-GAM-744-9]|uniref:YecA family protein n=1 Tax=Mesosutterella porci TaxID=2915351 RepID=A0ABS9MRC3_9BURK|nr:YecA family protein [Mesosutterella sp. oilRF-744-WT-GAM-9]MCG5031180.1 YecA family protein [Mesosutterella sp. oilRF-744-WT-GAM-9]
MKKNNARLSDAEFAELEELLASVPEEHHPLEADAADGYLTALLLHPQEVSPEDWMPYILDSEGREPALAAVPRLEELLYRRYREIDSQLRGKSPIDPVILEDDGPSGDELEPFALGFLTAVRLFPGLEETGSQAVNGALLGIFRHLPPEARGDLSGPIAEICRDFPLKDERDALDDLAACVAEIAEVTRGFKIPA